MLGINIKVDSKQVKDAKKQIEMLNRAMNDTDTLGDMTIGAGASAEVKKLAQEIQRLKQIATQGDNKGGILDRQQFVEAQKLLLNINAGVQNYAKNLASVKAEMTKINQEQRALAALKYGGTADPTDLKQFATNRQRLDELRKQQKELEAERQRIQQMGSGATDSANRIGGMGEDHSGAMSGIKKALGWGLAAAGGFSILGFIGQARNKYLQSIGHSVTLEGRGIKGGENAGLNIGMGPVEYMQYQENMSNSHVASTSSMKFAATMAKANGLDPNQMSGIYGSMYQSTGNADLGTGALARAVKAGFTGAKLKESLDLIARNTNTTAQAMKGNGATPDQVARSVAMAIYAQESSDNKKSYGQFAKSGEFSNIAQNGFQNSGTPIGEIEMAKVMGLFNGDMSWKKLYDIEKMKEEGPQANPEKFHELLSMTKGTLEERAIQLKKKNPAWNLSTKTAINLIDMDKDGFFQKVKDAGGLEGLSATSPEGKALVAKYGKEYESLTDAGKQTREAETEKLQKETGEALNRALAAWEATALKLGRSLLNADVMKSFIKTVEDIGKFAANPTKTMANELWNDVKNSTNPLFNKRTPVTLNSLHNLVTGGGAEPNTKRYSLPDRNGSSVSIEKKEPDPNGGFFSPKKGETADQFRERRSKTVRDFFDSIGSIFSTKEAGAAEYNYQAHKTDFARDGNIANRLKNGGISEKFIPIILKASKKYGVKPELIASVIDREGGNNPNITNKKSGAGGLMQLMPETARGLGVKDRFNPEENIMGGTKHLKGLIEKYDDNIPKALAAFNWGDGNVDKALQTGHGIPNKKYPDGSHFPDETEKYVKNVVSSMKKFGDEVGAVHDEKLYGLMFDLIHGQQQIADVLHIKKK